MASHKSAVVWTSVVDGILMSRTSRVNAIANTPSQKVSNREFGLSSVIFCRGLCWKNELVQYSIGQSRCGTAAARHVAHRVPPVLAPDLHHGNYEYLVTNDRRS